MSASRSVRELTGEIWAELQPLRLGPDGPLTGVTPEQIDLVLSTTLAVLARHVGARITADPDLPVDPLP